MITRVKKSVSISNSLLNDFTMLKINMNTSQLINTALVNYRDELMKKTRAARDIEILNANIYRFNKEAEENLEFQDEL